MERPSFEIGDVVKADSTGGRDFLFLRIVGKTKAGNLRVERMDCILLQQGSTPAESYSLIAANFQAPTISPTEVARWSTKNEGYQIPKGPDFHYVIRQKVTPGDTFEMNTYY